MSNLIPRPSRTAAYGLIPIALALLAVVATGPSGILPFTKSATTASKSSKMSLSNKLSITDVDLKGKRVLIRVDFNVPQDKTTLEITNPARIVAALPTIQYAIDNGK